ncbi:mucin-5AC isoform X1 [Cardiocondyla obscurior]|uniref:mucin-5AC isoform X1 n=1 Tax=Cardiocondyla obscurior TaxID=286306 RepID=UPI0039656091
MWLRSVLLICSIIAGTLADRSSDIVQISNDSLTRKNVAVTTYQPPRALSIEDFVTSHKLPENAAKPLDDDDEYFDEKKAAFKDNKQTKKVNQKLESTEKKVATVEPARRLDSGENDDLDSLTAKRQARVELENFSDTGKVLQEGRLKKVDSKRPRPSEQDEVIPGVYVSAEYPTTMLPILTTPREARSKDSLFDFVPVNIIREDSKDGFARFSDVSFGELGDVSLVPAGTNSRIQVKKGPNGKDYEYEYVYYYYDEDEDKAGTAGSPVTNSYDIPSRTTPAPRRQSGSISNRSKYTTVERSTVEPSNNEVIPNRNGNRGRQLVETDDISEERLPTNTRFPPRSRSNHNTGTTEASRNRNNRPRPNLDLVDSSSFRTHQEGPEFPQTLPKGPVRFLGVTPNEDNEEKPLIRNRGRPQRIQDPAPVEENVDDTPAPRRRLITTGSTETGVELSRGQPIRVSAEEDEEDTPQERSGNKRVSLEDKTHESSETETSPSYPNVTPDPTDNPTTEYPSIMDKVALDLYAFLQQGQNNLIDASSSESGETAADSTTLADEITTDLTTTAELADSILISNESNNTTPTTTTTTTEPTTTTTTTTEPPTTTTQLPAGRGKFRRPGLGSPAISRNRFNNKSNGGTSTTEVPAEPTQRTRARFGSNGSNGGGFKRPRPGGNHKPVEEDTVQKESASSANAEKPPGRGRFRTPTGGRIPVSTTTSAPSNGGTTAGAPRPTFNKLNINNRRRGRPTTAAPGSEEPQEGAAHSEPGQISTQTAPESATPKSAARTRLPGAPAIRPAIRPGNRVNLRQKPGQTTTTTTAAPEVPEGTVEEPAGEGTEEETHEVEAPAETNPPTRATTSNPLNKLRNRNRLQVQPKTTTKSPLPPAIRRSPLLPRRKVTETTVAQTSQEETAVEEETTSSEIEPTEVTFAETSTAASTKHEETRGLSGLLAPRRRIPARRPGQIVAQK